jgi:hypothetical protein
VRAGNSDKEDKGSAREKAVEGQEGGQGELKVEVVKKGGIEVGGARTIEGSQEMKGDGEGENKGEGQNERENEGVGAREGQDLIDASWGGLRAAANATSSSPSVSPVEAPTSKPGIRYLVLYILLRSHPTSFHIAPSHRIVDYLIVSNTASILRSYRSPTHLLPLCYYPLFSFLLCSLLSSSSVIFTGSKSVNLTSQSFPPSPPILPHSLHCLIPGTSMWISIVLPIAIVSVFLVLCVVCFSGKEESESQYRSIPENQGSPPPRARDGRVFVSSI